MRKMHIIIVVCAVMIFLILTVVYLVHTEERIIGSAKQLIINASEIGMGWVGEFGYISDPVKTFEETCEYLETMKDQLKKNITDEEVFQENLEKDKARFLELSDRLREYGVKDGYVLQLNKKIDGFTEGYAEVDVYVFNNIDGADEFFEYMKNKLNGSSISGIGDEAAISSAGYSYLVRISNAFVQIVVYDEEDVGRIIAEKIVEKATKC